MTPTKQTPSECKNWRTERHVGTTALRVIAMCNPTQNVSMATTLR